MRSTGRPWASRRQGALETWTPQIEVSHQNNELVVRADLPGLKKDDVSVDITEEAIAISGERRQEHESESGGYYRSERSYGSFYRTIPLPKGAISDQAKATFKDGVLEIRCHRAFKASSKLLQGFSFNADELCRGMFRHSDQTFWMVSKVLAALQTLRQYGGSHRCCSRAACSFMDFTDHR